eukprot:m.989547 g.989547  ORF g.989547 m.989547 type:complete len:814 (+) comp23996_c1_seq33:313-2754(+)
MRNGMSIMRIPVVFHVLHSGSTGKVSASRIRQQIEVLNDGFSGATSATYSDEYNSGMEFFLSETNYVDNAAWYSDCKTNSFDFRPRLTKNPKQFINVFVCSGSGYLGWTWLPWTHNEGSSMQAVIVNHNSLPGGTLSKYDLGYTLVHEVGHYFGLLHTFQRGTCSTLADDGVADTPMEARSGSSCGGNFDDFSRDTCPSDPGNDPLWSFMDYSYDRCMSRFSPGQIDRMREMIEVHRPKLLENTFNGFLGGATASRPPTKAPTQKPTPVPTHAPTSTPTPSDSIEILNHATSMKVSDTMVVKIEYSIYADEPVVGKVEILSPVGLWVGGSRTTRLSAGFASVAGTINLDVTIHGTPTAMSGYRVQAWLMKESDLDSAMPWLVRSATTESSVPITLWDADASAEVDPDSSTGTLVDGSACGALTDGAAGWKLRDGVCGGSKDKDGNCLGVSNYDDAAAQCEALGARLCTSDEVFEGIPRSTGCGYNKEYTWTSSVCTDGVIIVTPTKTDGNDPICVNKDLLTAQEHQVHTRCCAQNFATETDAPTAAPISEPTKAPEPCEDYITTCQRWKDVGYCAEDSLYFPYMNINCKATCGICSSAPEEPKACDLDVRDRCDSSDCCMDGLVCSVVGNNGNMRCLVPDPADGTPGYAVGEPCHRHTQCVSTFCDKNGIYGDEFRCQLGSLKSEEDFVGLGSSGKGSKDELLITLTVSSVACCHNQSCIGRFTMMNVVVSPPVYVVFCGVMIIVAVLAPGGVLWRHGNHRRWLRRVSQYAQPKVLHGTPHERAPVPSTVRRCMCALTSRGPHATKFMLVHRL